jgi:hypothetical protein
MLELFLKRLANMEVAFLVSQVDGLNQLFRKINFLTAEGCYIDIQRNI